MYFPEWLKIQDNAFREWGSPSELEREKIAWSNRFLWKGIIFSIWSLMITVPIAILCEIASR